MHTVDSNVLVVVVDEGLVIPILTHEDVDLIEELLDRPNTTFA